MTLLLDVELGVLWCNKEPGNKASSVLWMLADRHQDIEKTTNNTRARKPIVSFNLLLNYLVKYFIIAVPSTVSVPWLPEFLFFSFHCNRQWVFGEPQPDKTMKKKKKTSGTRVQFQRKIFLINLTKQHEAPKPFVDIPQNPITVGSLPFNLVK